MLLCLFVPISILHITLRVCVYFIEHVSSEAKPTDLLYKLILVAEMGNRRRRKTFSLFGNIFSISSFCSRNRRSGKRFPLRKTAIYFSHFPPPEESFPPIFTCSASAGQQLLRIVVVVVVVVVVLVLVLVLVGTKLNYLRRLWCS